MTSSPKRISTASAIGYGAALTLALLSFVGRAIAAHAQGLSWFDVISGVALIVGGILLIALLLFELYAWLIRARTRMLTGEYPGAFLATVPTDPALVESANAFAVASAGERTRLVPSSYMALVADRQEVRFVRGWHRPHVVARFRVPTIERIEIGSAQAGARIIPTLDLVCRDGLARGRISVHLMTFRRGVPGFVRDEALDAEALRLGAATGIAVGASATATT